MTALIDGLGGADPDTYDALEREGRPTELPTDHSPAYAPTLDPTVRVGVEAMLTAAGAWLAR